MPVKWQEDLLASKNPKRDDYIQALKKADNSDFVDLIAIQGLAEAHLLRYFLNYLKSMDTIYQ